MLCGMARTNVPLPMSIPLPMPIPLPEPIPPVPIPLPKHGAAGLTAKTSRSAQAGYRALIALPHTDISKKGNMTNIFHLTLPFPPLCISLVSTTTPRPPISATSTLNRLDQRPRHLMPQVPASPSSRPSTASTDNPMPDASSPCVARPSTSTASTDNPNARCHKSLYHPALNPQPSTTDDPNAQCLKSPCCPALDPQLP